ncbi:MAG: hypothetical protein JSR39_08730 [Verrucomicrobia bacterium]|nr:hypothetical protein [Verrucomicrobiota bacterium]
MLKAPLKSVALLLPLLFSNAHAAVQTAAPAAEAQHSPAAPNTPSSSLVIDPKMRAQDFKEAFETLRKEKTTGKVFFQLMNGSTVSNIIDMTLMSNSTLILFRFNSTQGIRFQLVKVEEIASISYI